MTESTRDGNAKPGVLQATRSVIHLTVVILSTVLWAGLSLLALPLPYRARYWFVTRWTHFNLWWARFSCGIGWELRGLENIPERPCVVMSKHQSAWETMGLQLCFNPQTWVLKRELIRIPFLGWALWMLEPIAIDRGSGRDALKQLIRKGKERINAGRWVVVFPEGTRVPPGQRGRYRIGGAALARAAGCPVVPVAHNAGRFWGRQALLKRPGTVEVRIGPPIPSKGKSPEELTREVEAWIEEQMAEL